MKLEIVIQRELLRAMQSLGQLRGARIKCDLVLRQTLQSLGEYTLAAEAALCNAGDEDAATKRFYDLLRRLVERGFADGAGDLRSPAGPRYTECRITAKGKEWLVKLLETLPQH
jgi:hypothetical protein